MSENPFTATRQENSRRKAMGEEGGSMSHHEFTLQRSQSSMSWFSGRSKRYDRLLRDSLSPDRLIPLPGYQKLSKSVRVLSEEGEPPPPPQQQPWPGGWARQVMRRVFSFRKEGGGGLSVPEDKRKVRRTKKKRSSWLPDPDRRWPVQGW